MTPKALEWQTGWHKTEIGDHIASTALGKYACRQTSLGQWSIWLGERCLGDKAGGVRETFGLDTAKRKAQADFNRRACEMVRNLMEAEA